MSKRIRVLHTEWSNGWGGQEIRIINEMSIVREYGVEPFLACREEAKIKDEALKRGFRVFSLPFRGNLDFKTLFKLIKIIKDNRIDIVNTHSGKDTWVGGVSAKIAGAKFIRTRHLSNPINPSRVNFINELADFIITTGEVVREDMIKNNRINPSKILSIPTGVDENRFNPNCYKKEEARAKFGISPKKIAIGNVAVLRRFKRHDMLIEAFYLLTKKYPDIELLIAGEGPQREKLENIIKNRGLIGKVKLLGHLREPQELLKALDIFVLSSDSKEGVPQSLIQALMMNKAVVATDVGSVIDLYNANFILSKPEVKQLAEDIESLIVDKSLREYYENVARESIVDRFSLSKMGSDILEVYKRVLS